MASFKSLTLLLALLGLQGVLGGLECEKLPVQMCAFSVSATGGRCVLEKYVMRDGSIEYECQSSEIIAEKMMEWIESEECLEACSLERMSVGVSSDALLESHFTKKLCSPQCQNNCPNIVDLYLNLAAGEGSILGIIGSIGSILPTKVVTRIILSLILLLGAIARASTRVPTPPPIWFLLTVL
eukprot:Gb_38850 [translate_table: standard]